MKHLNKLFLVILCCTSFFSYTQVLISEDFSSVTGNNPPAGWVNNEISVGNGDWFFNNPGGWTTASPISEPFAIFDSDYLGPFLDDDSDAALESPEFDASSITGSILLSFDHHFYDNYLGAIITVEVWDGSNWVEVYFESSISELIEHKIIDITSAVNNASDAKVRFRYVGNYTWYWIVDNIVVEAYNCPIISSPSASNVQPSSADIEWVAGGSESNWDIEWGPLGFTPGTGSEIGNASVTSENFSITNLVPATAYVAYVRSNCQNGDVGPWISIPFTTSCAPIGTYPYFNNFESLNAGYPYYELPLCWESVEQHWFSDFQGSWDIGIPAYSGTKYLGIYGGYMDTLWSPEFIMNTNSIYEMSFMLGGTDYINTDWTAGVVVRNTATGDIIHLGDFLSPSDQVASGFIPISNCFQPVATGVYQFGITAQSFSWDAYFIALDDFKVNERGSSAGTGATTTVCQSGDLVDLEALATIIDTEGNWTSSFNPNSIENDHFLNPGVFLSGTYEINYITTGCLEDTVTVIVTIDEAARAGEDGTITACKNQPLDVINGLGGSVHLGGTWYGPNSQPLPSSQIMTANIPGQYNYKYVVGNGTCPNDTATVLLTVLSNCDWLSIEEALFEEVAIYPNPTQDIVNLFIPADNMKLVVFDVNGRIVVDETTLAKNNNQVKLTNLEKGTYFFRITTGEQSKVFHVVKN